MKQNHDVNDVDRKKRLQRTLSQQINCAGCGYNGTQGTYVGYGYVFPLNLSGVSYLTICPSCGLARPHAGDPLVMKALEDCNPREIYEPRNTNRLFKDDEFFY